MYLLIFVFFSVKEFGNWRKEKKNKKTKEEILKKGTESIMREEIVNEDI